MQTIQILEKYNNEIEVKFEEDITYFKCKRLLSLQVSEEVMEILRGDNWEQKCRELLNDNK